ncbi:hypothetical protein, partial [uncultured Nocardioides sp.]|uniref:hypothetical protein n=1 Tax=uncultured Nocardioides sp. TaxID=198441 RepID=UPI000C3BAC7D
PIAVPADTWRRGRRRRTLKRGGALLVGAAVVAGVALGAGVLLGADDRALPPADSVGGLGLPDHLHAPPERMSDIDPEFGGWMREEVLRGDELAVGPAVAAWVTPGGLPVVVDARTGEHHLLDLPHVVSANLEARTFAAPDWQPLALSPDGTRLAYGTVRFGRDGASTGVRVLDLTTGESAWRRELVGGAGIVVTELSWSPSGTWLAWQGRQTREWTGSSIAGSLPVAGVVGPDPSGGVEEVTGGGAIVARDDGAGYIVTPGEIEILSSCPVDARCPHPPVPRTWPSVGVDLAPRAALSPDGSTLALSTFDGYDLVTLGLFERRVTTGAEGMPDDRPWQVSALGWVDEGHVVVLRDDNQGGDGLLSIVPVDPERGTSVDVGVVDSAVGTPSIAIDLVTLDRPTVDRPDPRWPWSEERWALTLAGGFAGVLLVGLFLLARAAGTRRAR